MDESDFAVDFATHMSDDLRSLPSLTSFNLELAP